MTRAELQAKLERYLAAEARILHSQEYQVGDGAKARTNRRAPLEAVQAEIRRIRAEIEAIDRASASGSVAGLSASRRGGRIVYARPAR